MRPLFVCIFAFVLICLNIPGRAAAGPTATVGAIGSFTQLCTGSISYSVVDIAQTRMPGSQACTFYLVVTTGANPGSVTVTAPKIVGSTGATIPQSAFYALCSVVYDPSGIFSSSGTVQLSASAVSCGKIASNQANKTLLFSVSLFLDDTADATSFAGDPAYTSANLSVTATAP